jgi:serine/threonine protein kinase
VDVSIWKSVISSKPKASFDEGDDLLERPSDVDPAGNVYSFGILLLEIISGKLPYSPEEGSLVNLVRLALRERKKIELYLLSG